MSWKKTETTALTLVTQSNTAGTSSSTQVPQINPYGNYPYQYPYPYPYSYSYPYNYGYNWSQTALTSTTSLSAAASTSQASTSKTSSPATASINKVKTTFVGTVAPPSLPPYPLPNYAYPYPSTYPYAGYSMPPYYNPYGIPPSIGYPQTVPPFPVPTTVSTTVTTTATASSASTLTSLTSKTDEKNVVPQKKEYYCQLCKLVCVGSGCLRTHLQGNRHRKRVSYFRKTQKNDKVSNKAAITILGKTPISDSDIAVIKQEPFDLENFDILPEANSQTVILACQICELECYGIDSYQTHVLGNRHQKTIALKRKLKETIPSNMPKILSKKVPKVLYNRIKDLFGDNPDGKPIRKEELERVVENVIVTLNDPEKERILDSFPVGQDLIEEVLNENGKLVCYTCTLCECRFNDFKAKELHVKGKRHRIMYKKKIDPSLLLDFIRSDLNKIKQPVQEEPPHTLGYLTQDLDPFLSDKHSKLFHSVINKNVSHTLTINGKHVRSFSDYLLEHRHLQITMKRADIDCVFRIAFMVEKAIRKVAKYIEFAFLRPKQCTFISTIKYELMKFNKIQSKLKATDIDKIKEPIRPSFIRLVRVGALGESLMIDGEDKFDMVILASILPSTTLLVLFEQLVPDQIRKLAQIKMKNTEKFVVTSELLQEDAKFVIMVCIKMGEVYKMLYFHIYITSPYIRNVSTDILKKITPDLLNVKKCLGALNEIRRFRWFKDRVVQFQFFCFVVRILRDLANRLRSWSCITLWMIQVSIEKIMVSANRLLPPSSLFRHFFEFLSYGVCLKKSGGLADPCEKELKNIFEPLTKQQAEDITASSQFILRLIALRHLHQVILVNPIEVYKIRMIELKTYEDAEAKKEMEMKKSEIKPAKIKYVGREIQIDSDKAYDVSDDLHDKQSTSIVEEVSSDQNKITTEETRSEGETLPPNVDLVSLESSIIKTDTTNTILKRKIDEESSEELSVKKSKTN